MTKILVVDDESDIQLLVSQRFSKHIKSKELQFIFASNGMEALQVLNRHKDIHIIVTDINMPEMDGLTFLSHLSDLNRILKTVIISAYGDMANIRKAMNKGACDFITKPIDFKDLEITIFNAVDQCLTLKKAAEAQSTLFDIEKELTIAHAIQQTFIPHQFKPFPDTKSFEIQGKMIPARQVGGDFFDFFPIDEDHLGFVIADVSGKGIPAALFMSMSRAIIRTLSQMKYSPADCLTAANRSLSVDNDTCMFVTAFYGIFNLSTGEIECSNAGHNPPYLKRADGSIQQIGVNHGIPLAVLESSVYYSEKLVLNKNDTLILYTDGITEAMNIRQELYSEQRLERIIQSWSSHSLSSLTDSILQDVQAFSKEMPQYDDITLLCLKQLV